MALETGNYLAALTITNPAATDSRGQGDDHLRFIKTKLLETFLGFSGPILLGGVGAGAVNAYTLTPSTALIGYVANTLVFWQVPITNTAAVTVNVSALGTRSVKRIDGSALTSGDLVALQWVAMIDTGTEYRLLGITKNYVDQLSFAAAGLPAQAASTFLFSDGTNMSWVAAAALAVANTFSAAQRGAVTALTSSAASIAINLAATNNFSHATTENTTLAAPTNAVAGQSGIITFTQGATARTLAYNTFWKFPGGTIPVLTATVGAVDLLAYYVESASRATCQMIKDSK